MPKIISTQNKNIIESLKREPWQMQKINPWYFWIKRTLTLPLRVLTFPLRWLFMRIICPISYEDDTVSDEFLVGGKNLTEKAKNAFSIHEINYQISKNDRCSMFLCANMKNNDTPASKRKLVINFGGNLEFISDRLTTILRSVGKPISNDIIFVLYPNKATSSQELVDGGKSAILRAINAGYQINNITIAGHSLGGAVSAIAMNAVKPHLNGQEFWHYINHRSFTNLGDIIGAYLNYSNDNEKELRHKAKSSWIGQIVNRLTEILGLQLDAEKAIRAGLPVNSMTLYRCQEDEVIKTGASIAAAINNHEIDTTAPVTFNVTKNQHNDKCSNKIYGADEESQNYDYFQQNINRDGNAVGKHCRKFHR